ncbi:MAG TPA: SMI1/KNR4 family protein [Solirubrobacteraceae bacterium]|jgi:cell wall assembly regulator SMI1
MDADVTLLDPSMLDVYEELLRAQGVPVDEWLNPGLTKEEMDTKAASIGLTLPTEARVWWEWHDGESRDSRESALGPFKPFLPLDVAIEQYMMSRDVAMKAAEPDNPPLDDPDFLWPPVWLPIGGDGGHPVVIDCSVAEGEPTPLWAVMWAAAVEDRAELASPSLGQMVAWRIEALENGAWKWDPETSYWEEENRDLLPQALRLHSFL